MRIHSERDGFTLVEVLVGIAAALIIFSAAATSFLVVKSITQMARHKMEVLQLLRGQVELLKATSFQVLRPQAGQPIGTLSLTNTAGTSTPITRTAAYDAGPNGTFGAPDPNFGYPVPEADDLTVTLTITAGDFLDMDNDCGANPNCRSETAIDVDNDGTNDVAAVLPVRVRATWSERTLGQTKVCSEYVDTLIAS